MRPGMGARNRDRKRTDLLLGLCGTATTVPSVYMPDYSSLPVKNQGTFGTCGGHAGSALVSFLGMQDLSPKYLWTQIKQIDNIPLSDGTDMNFIFQSLHSTGDCHEALLPDTLPTTIEEYSSPSNITQQMLSDAEPYGTGKPAFTEKPTWAQLQSAIFNNKVVIAQVHCGTGWYTTADGKETTYEAKDILPIRLGTLLDDHFIIMWGYDENYIYFRNSWGNTWGNNGDGYMDQSYLSNVVEIGAAVETPSLTQQLVSKYEQVICDLEEEIQIIKKQI